MDVRTFAFNPAQPDEVYASTCWGPLRSTDGCLLYTSDAADERSSVDLGGRRIIKKKKTVVFTDPTSLYTLI